MTRPKPQRPRWASLAIVALASALGGGLAVVLPATAGNQGNEGAAATAGASSRPHPRIGKAQKPRRKKARRRAAQRRVVRVGPAGPPGPAGPAGPPGPQIATALTVNWRGLDNAPGHDTASAEILGIGSLLATCNASTQALTLLPAATGNRSVLDVATFEGEGSAAASHQRLYSESTAAVSVPLPNNGMLNATVSAEPIGGNGSGMPAPATLLLSSEWKTNDPNPALNHCFVAGQVLQQR